jgi:hypothetical protein
MNTYRRNITLTNGNGAALGIQEESRITRLHFGGKLNSEDIRLFAILDVTLPGDILRATATDEDWHKRIQLDKLDFEEIDRNTPGMSRRLAMLSVYWIVQHLTIESFPRPTGIISMLMVSRAISLLPIVGSYLDAKFADRLGGLPHEAYKDCIGLINHAGQASGVLDDMAGDREEDPRDQMFMISLSKLLEGLQGMLLATCQPVCPDPECDASHEYPTLEVAKKQLLKAAIKFALDAGIYPEFRKSYVNNLLRLYERRIF